MRFVFAFLITAAAALAQDPAGRWDGTVQFGALAIPFRIDFEGSGAALKASFVNGPSRVSSASGTFADGKVHLTFASGTKLDGTLGDGKLEGTIGAQSFTASAFCSCGYEGEAGPAIMGTYKTTGGWTLSIKRDGEDSFATVTRAGSDIGPLAGRSDGISFALHFFDGTHAALLEIEPDKNGGLDLVWKEPGQDPKKLKASK
jgi:hypothetical protein